MSRALVPRPRPDPRGASHFGTRRALSLAFSTPRLTPSRTPQIDASELKATLNAMGQNPTEEEIFQMISQVDDDNSGEIEFAEFMKVIENQKRPPPRRATRRTPSRRSWRWEATRTKQGKSPRKS